MLAGEDTDPLGWERTMLSFEMENTAEEGQLDLGIYLRFDGTLDVQRVRMGVRAQAPDGAWVQDSVVANVAHHGGNGFFEISIPYRNGVVFSQTGTYRFTIGTASPVRGVRAVGIIER